MLPLQLLKFTVLAVVLGLAGCDSSSADKVSGPVVAGPGGTGGTGGGSGGGSGTGSGGSGTGTGTGSGSASNSAPTAKSDVGVVMVNSSNNPVNVLANDSDADGDALTITAVGLNQSLPPTAGAVLAIAADGKTLRYTPPLGFVGQQIISYTVSDGRGGTAQALAVLTTSPLQVPPAALPDAFSLITDSTITTLNVLGNDIDGAGGGLVVSAASSTASVPAGNAGSVSVVNGALRYQPRAGFIGVETLSYTLRDANGATASATVLVTVLPLAAPPVALPDVAITAIATTVNITVLANDVDLAGGGLTVTAAEPLTTLPLGSNGSFAVQANGSLRYTPPSASFVGVQTGRYTVRDVNGNVGTGLVTVTVAPALPSVPPVAVPDVVTLAADSGLSQLDVRANDVDLSGGGLTITAASLVAALPPTSAATVATDGSRVQLTPPAGYAGVLTLSYTIRNAAGATATAPVLVTVTPATLPPVAVPDAATLAQDAPATDIAVLANDLDLSGGGLTLAAVETANSLPVASHTLAVAGNQLRFTPATGFAGVVVVRYTVRDANGRSSPGLATVVVTPAALALAPVAIPDLGNLAQGSAATDFAVLANDLDPAGGGLSLGAASVLSSLPTASHTLSLAGNQVRLTPASGFAGVIVVQYTAVGSNGRSAMGLLSVVVSPVALSVGPVALPDLGTLTQNAAATDFTVLANDLDPLGSGLTVGSASVLSSLPTASHTVGVAGNRVRVTPAAGFAGVVVVQYTAIDAGGRSASSLLSLVVSPLATSLGPVALPDVGTVTQNAAATNFAVLANDLDPTSAGLSLTAASVTSSLPSATHTVSLAGNQLRFTPASGFAGTVLVQYTVTDGGGRSATGILSLVVSPLPTVLGPVALPDVGTVTQNAAATDFAVLANDLDPTNTGLSLTAASIISSLPTATHTVSLAGNQLRIAPASGFAGTVLVQYTVTDGGGRSAIGILSLVVSPLPTVLGPVALPDAGTVTQNAAATNFAVLANDLDPTSAGLSLTAASVSSSLPSATHTVSLAGNQLRFTPASGFAGTVLVQYTVTDGGGRSATGILSLVVSPLPTVLGPVALPDVGTVTQNAAATDFAVLANDLDPASAGLSLTVASISGSLPIATHTVSLAGNQLRFTPASGFAGTVLVQYTVTDGNARTAAGLLSLVVSPLAPLAGPVALPDVAVLAQNSAATLINVRANDVDPAAAGLTVTAASVQSSLPSASHTVAVNSNQVQFTPAASFAGIVTLAYTVRDGNNATSNGLVAITVTPSSPVALPAAIGDVGALVVTLLAGSTGNYSVLANDIDPSAGGLTLQTVSFVNPLLVTPGSLLSIVGSQVRLTVPLLGVITGVLPIQYTATDSLGRTITGLLSVTLSI